MTARLPTPGPLRCPLSLWKSSGHGLLTRLPHLSVLGGCCGTDVRHIVALMNTELPDVAVRGADGETST